MVNQVLKGVILGVKGVIYKKNDTFKKYLIFKIFLTKGVKGVKGVILYCRKIINI